MPRTAVKKKPAEVEVEAPYFGPTWGMVPIKYLIVDGRYQRDVKEPFVERVAKEWDPALVNVLEVSKRSEVEYAVFDGQQRLNAAIRRGDIEELPCLIHTGLTPEEEASLFTRLQDNRVPMQPLDRFKARQFGRDPTAVDIVEIATKNGYQIGNGKGQLSAIFKVEQVYRRGNLDETLQLLSIWRDEQKALESSFIEGVSRFIEYFAEYRDNDGKVYHVDWERVNEKWAEVASAVILRRTAEYQDNLTSSKGRGVLEVLREIYNKGLHGKGALPTVYNASEAKRKAASERSRRYKRPGFEEFLDTVMDMRDFSFEEIRDKLETSREHLMKKPEGLIQVAIDRGYVKRYRPGGRSGGHRFAYVPIEQQVKQRQRQAAQREYLAQKRERATTAAAEAPIRTSRKRGGAPVSGTGRSNAQKATNPDIRDLLKEIKASVPDVKMDLAGSGHWIVEGPGMNKITIPNTPSDPRAIANSRSQARREGYLTSKR